MPRGGGSSNNNQTGGLGAYARGEVSLTKGQTLYINVGGQGESGSSKGSADSPVVYKGGYNGGGNGGSGSTQLGYGGGGATHIALVSGELSTLTSKTNQILIVAAGGGGNGSSNNAFGGSGGGIQGNNGTNTVSPYTGYYGTGGTQTTAGDDIKFPSHEAQGKFGLGGNYYADPLNNSAYVSGAGGGGGYYGGGGSSRGHAGAGGGSSYIGNQLLTNKVMYCYNCLESDAVNTKTISVEYASENPISGYAKRGNGAAKITYLGK